MNVSPLRTGSVVTAFPPAAEIYSWWQYAMKYRLPRQIADLLYRFYLLARENAERRAPLDNVRVLAAQVDVQGGDRSKIFFEPEARGPYFELPNGYPIDVLGDAQKNGFCPVRFELERWLVWARAHAGERMWQEGPIQGWIRCSDFRTRTSP